MKILHVLYTSLPDVTGSSIRSDGLLTGQLQAGMSAIAITSPFQRPATPGQAVERINGVDYHRSYNLREGQVASEVGSRLYLRVLKLLQIFKFARKIKRVAVQYKPDLLHAHSMFFCGLSASWVARNLGCPYVYEVRSLWEERSAGLGVLSRYVVRILRRLELMAMLRADAIVVINDGLKDNLVARGISAEKIFVVPNCVSEELVLASRNKMWTGRAGAPLRFAYIGNLSNIEGIDVLIESYSELWERRGGALEPLRIYGSGVYASHLAELAQKLAPEAVEFHGGFKREDLQAVYDDVDCIVLPRRRLQITESVTPLKPLEAMAFKKLVMISDVGGLLEVVGPDRPAIVFCAEDKTALRVAIERILDADRPALTEIVNEGYRFVSEQRIWREKAEAFKGVYQFVLGSTDG